MLVLFAPFLTWSYWFTSYPAPFSGPTFWIVVGLTVGGVVLGLALKLGAGWLKEPSTRRIIKRLGSLSITMGLLTGVSFFFTQTSTPTLGSRFWFGLWLLVALVWLVFILRYVFAQAPRERAERAKQLEYQKYLPR
ncbi:MAG: hypothetical protein Q8P77_02105 [Candidatus Veblenbacteria bacterium]|nr:hypothetical protein [Candidatus Veblenbacteria bacterium]